MNRRTSDDDEMIMLLVAVLFGPPLLMALIPGLASKVGQWLTQHQVLVCGPALFTFPGLEAGLDGRRVVIALLLLCAIALTIWARRARRDVA